jgi:short-subunit dehydrogenase
MSVRRIAITGASSGIGSALAVLYAAPGVTLGLMGRDPGRLRQVAAECAAQGAQVELLACDVRDRERLQDWLRDFAARSPIDLLIASAGISGGIRAGERTESGAQTRQLVAINLLGVVDTMEAVLPAMLAQGRGRIGIVSSVAGYRGLPYSPGYSASKAGIRAYGEAMRAQLRPLGIRISVICPGFVDTPMTDRFLGDHPFLVSAPRAAALIRRGLDAGRARIAFPGLLALGLRLTDLMPAWIGDRILRHFHFEILPSPGMEDTARPPAVAAPEQAAE